MKVEIELNPKVVELFNRNVGTLVSSDVGRGLAISVQEIINDITSQAWVAGKKEGREELTPSIEALQTQVRNFEQQVAHMQSVIDSYTQPQSEAQPAHYRHPSAHTVEDVAVKAQSL